MLCPGGFQPGLQPVGSHPAEIVIAIFRCGGRSDYPAFYPQYGRDGINAPMVQKDDGGQTETKKKRR